MELRRYAAARGWDARESVDHGVSGAKERRPALDAMVADAKRRRFDAVVVWRLDRLGRSIKHLNTLIEELQALGIAYVSLGEGIDATTRQASCNSTSSWPSRSSNGRGFRNAYGPVWRVRRRRESAWAYPPGTCRSNGSPAWPV